MVSNIEKIDASFDLTLRRINLLIIIIYSLCVHVDNRRMIHYCCYISMNEVKFKIPQKKCRFVVVPVRWSLNIEPIR